MARRLRTTALILGLLVAGSRQIAQGAATSPTLLLSSVAARSVLGKRTLTFEGLFDFENALQVAYPLHLVVFQGTRFVRYPVAGTPVTGDSALLADGVLADGELAAFLAAGSAAPSGVRLVTLTPTGGVVALPDDLTPGNATAVLFTVLPEENVISNPVTFVLP